MDLIKKKWDINDNLGVLIEKIMKLFIIKIKN